MNTENNKLIAWFENLESFQQDDWMLKFRLANDLSVFNPTNKEEHDKFFLWLSKQQTTGHE